MATDNSILSFRVAALRLTLGSIDAMDESPPSNLTACIGARINALQLVGRRCSVGEYDSRV